ncbi:hypothetical protein ABL78_7242 [Leptomonas seymouri]|uniref:Uncharacterized protein n=1 Tax=Leptomonas seymouri TaxID=5684 RepID=A0A0N1P9X8_LEPSE|nr:hypothetical protein ABL78_7242 [Leptomonas seymouri]|eukprot:KPI83722.1 hypothetical protein ABL78_7242 [Leptomonas seymouri]
MRGSDAAVRAGQTSVLHVTGSSRIMKGVLWLGAAPSEVLFSFSRLRQRRTHFCFTELCGCWRWMGPRRLLTFAVGIAHDAELRRFTRFFLSSSSAVPSCRKGEGNGGGGVSTLRMYLLFCCASAFALCERAPLLIACLCMAALYSKRCMRPLLPL